MPHLTLMRCSSTKGEAVYLFYSLCVCDFLCIERNFFPGIFSKVCIHTNGYGYMNLILTDDIYINF